MVMVGEVPSVCPSVRHTLLCATPPTVLMRFEPNFHRIIVMKCRSAYFQYFAIPLFIKELLPFFKIYTVRNSSYNSYAIWTKLSQNDCHQVPQRILSVFCDSITYQEVIAHCLNICAQLILQFSCFFFFFFFFFFFLWNFHRMMVTKCWGAYCQDFAIPFFIKELLPLF